MKSPIQIDVQSSTPKYRQIIESVINAIQDKSLKPGDALPSINQLSGDYTLARDTVTKAYNELRKRGIVSSIHGKGFFVSTTRVRQQIKIFVLFDELNAYKRALYEGLKDRLGKQGVVDIFFHHFNIRTYQYLIEESLGNYTHYVVMPFRHKAVPDLLRRIPRDRLMILDIPWMELELTYPSICQNFYKATRECLNQVVDRIRKYKRFVIVFRTIIKEPREIISGFRDFCEEHRIEHSAIISVRDWVIQPGDAYFVIEDDDLVQLVKQAKQRGLTSGRDVGFISFNDVPFKEIIEGGITVISTDFRRLGQRTAEHVIQRRRTNEESPSSLILRNSL